MASGGHVTFTVNGMVVSGSLNASNLASGGVIKTPKHYPAPDACGKRRGGPRSKVYCQVYKIVDHHTHVGRSSRSGKWYLWDDREEQT